jgi:hypothetical protein
LAGLVVAIGGLATLLFWPGQDRAGKLLKLATAPIRK